MLSTQQSSMKALDFKRALVYFLLAYALVTILATATTVIYGMVYHLPEPEQLGVGLYRHPRLPRPCLTTC